MKIHEILENINVDNWYLGNITAFKAWHTGATIKKKDCAKVRRILKKHGYKCSICGGIIGEIISIN
jgi:hypothetical protein